MVWLAIDGELRGAFVLANAVRPETDELLRGLGARYELALLSGDNEKERERFRGLFGRNARAAFQPEPAGQAGLHPPAAGVRQDGDDGRRRAERRRGAQAERRGRGGGREGRAPSRPPAT